MSAPEGRRRLVFGAGRLPRSAREAGAVHRLLLAARGEAGLGRARTAAARLERSSEALTEVVGGGPADLAARAAALRATLVVYALEGPGPIGLDPAALALAQASPAAALLLKPDTPWPPGRALLPLRGAEAGSGWLASASGWIAALGGRESGGPGLEVLHVGRDADEWSHARERLLEQIPALGRPVAVRSCMRFGAEPVRRTLQAIADSDADLVVLARPAGGGSAEWTRLVAGCRPALLVLPAPALPDPEPARSPWRGWLPLPRLAA